MSISRQSVPVIPDFGSHGLGIWESHHDEGFAMQFRSDPYPKILVFIGGEGYLELEDQRVAIQAPMLCVVPEGIVHRLVDKRRSPLSVYGICFTGSAYPSEEIVKAACREFRVENGHGFMKTVETWLRSLLVEQRSKREGYEALQQSIVTSLLIDLIRSPHRQSAVIEDSRSRVEGYAKALERDFWKEAEIDAVARDLGLSRRRFTQLFREVTGESWQRKLRALRMRYASDLLIHTSLTVRSIAFECGYRDMAHFYRVFNQSFGTSPGRYRESKKDDP